MLVWNDAARKKLATVPDNAARREVAVVHCYPNGTSEKSSARQTGTRGHRGILTLSAGTHPVELRIHSQTAQSQQRYGMAAIMEADAARGSTA